MRRYDIALAVWAAVWIALGAVVFDQVRSIGDLANSLVTAGRALDGTADGLNQIGGAIDDIPFVDDVAELEEIERRVRAGAQEARATARDARAGAERLAWILAAITALVPTVPLLALRLALGAKLRGP